MTRPRILLAEDDPAVAFGIRDFLESHGFEVVVAASCVAALQSAESLPPDIAILDYQLPDGDALAILERLRAAASDVSVIVLTGHGSIELAVRAIQAGAEQFVTKPIELPTLLVLVNRVLENQRLRKKQSAGLRRQSRAAADPFLGRSDAIRRLEEETRLTLQSERPVLIEGETGTGKGLLAVWIHRNGPRADEAFVDLNCAGLSPEPLGSELFGRESGAPSELSDTRSGLLEMAHRGTLFLDEVGEMDPVIQPKLLGVIEGSRFRRIGDAREREVDVRLITASHRDLGDLVRRRRFREDLYYRINAMPIRVPPLRDRREDIAPIAEDMLGRLSTETGRPGLALSPAAVTALEAYPWPGNLRELRNVLERAALRCRAERIEPGDLRLDSADGPRTVEERDLTLAELERLHIERALEREGGHVERAAKRLGVPRSTLYQRLKTMGIPLHR